MEMTDQEDKQFMEDSNAISERLIEEVYPVLEELDEMYPEQSAFYAMFVNSVHVLYHEGWTIEELKEELEEHHELYLKDLVEDRNVDELH